MAKQQYVTFAWLINSKIQSFIYAKPLEAIREGLVRVAQENCNMQSGTHPSFVYKDQFYNPTATIPEVRKLRLLPKFRPVVDEINQEEIAIHAEMKAIGAYIVKTLNMSRSVNDYFRLFPETLHDVLRQNTAQDRSFMLNRVTDEQVEQYKEENKHFFETIRNRLTINLIT